MHTNSSPQPIKGERDPRLFMWLVVTLAVSGIYAITLLNNPSVRQPLVLLIFTGLTLAHIWLHWQLGRIVDQSRKLSWYILLQGVLAFGILLFTNNPLMSNVLFMILIGEAIGVFGLTRKGLVAAAYFWALLTLSQVIFSGWDTAGIILLGTIPMSVFVILFVGLYMRQNEARQEAQTLAAQLEAADNQLAEYAVQVEKLTLSAERQRIARELHDTLSQGLTGLVLQLEAVKAHLQAGQDERAYAIIIQSLARARSTLANSRNAIDDLRAIPSSLPEAMQAKSERFIQATGIPCDLLIALGDYEPHPDTGDNLLRVLSEALTNITRHAQASQVWVTLKEKDDHIELEIRDDGQGFETGRAIEAGHYGLLGMRERARLMGGNLDIKTGTGQGTRVRLNVPIFQQN
jgi:NarL family two-component system sensor histidine kinase YdfH